MASNNANAKSKRWYLDEVFYWRCVSCSLWASFIQIFVCVFIITTLKANLNPHIWLKDSISAIFSMHNLSQVLTATVIVIATVTIHTYCFQMSPDLNTTRAALLWRIIQPYHLVVIAFYAVSAAILVYVYIGSLEDFSSLTGPCWYNSNLLCVNHRLLIVVLNGGFVGLMFGIHYFVSDYRYLSFQIFQQRKFIQIKQSVRPKVMESFAITLSNMKWFAIAYCITGGSITSYMESFLKLQPIGREYVAQWSTLYSLLDLNLWLVMALTGSATYFLFWETICVFKIFQTEIVNFQIENPLIGSQLQTLVQAMSCSDFPLLQYMAHLDLLQLSQWSTERRSEIFKLSQPGGHPRNFTEISSQCLSLIKNLTDTLNSHAQQNVKSDKLEQSTLKTPHSKSPARTIPITLMPSPIDTVTLYFQRMKKVIVAALLNIRLIGYLFKELPDIKNRQAFAKCQPHIWAFEALTFLAVSARQEDKFGVVQTKLPEILTIMLDLKQALDQKFDNSSLKRPLKDLASLPQDVYIKFSLKYSLVASLYKITTTFGENIRLLHLPGNYQTMLVKFLEFKV